MSTLRFRASSINWIPNSSLRCQMYWICCSRSYGHPWLHLRFELQTIQIPKTYLVDPTSQGGATPLTRACSSVEIYLDGQWAPQTSNIINKWKLDFHISQCIRSTSSPGLSTRYIRCWTPGRHPSSVPWCRPGSHRLEAKQLGVVSVCSQNSQCSQSTSWPRCRSGTQDSWTAWVIQVPVVFYKSLCIWSTVHRVRSNGFTGLRVSQKKITKTCFSQILL